MGRRPTLRPDGTIDPAAWEVTPTGCHLWKRQLIRGVPVMNQGPTTFRVRNWLLGLPGGCWTETTCGELRCVNPEHVIRHVPAPPTSRPEADHPSRVDPAKQQARTEAELAKAPEQRRKLSLVRDDIARLLDLVPAGVIAGEDREGLRAFADGESYQAIGDRQGVSRQRIHQRLQAADQQLRQALRAIEPSPE